MKIEILITYVVGDERHLNGLLATSSELSNCHSISSYSTILSDEGKPLMLLSRKPDIVADSAAPA